jgi:hypothetical protein
MTKAAEKATISRRERHPPHPIVAGEKFHRLTVIEKIANRPGSYWKFKCECGNDVIATSSAVRTGNNKSCGCLKSENAINKNKTHGLSHLPEYKVWTGMAERCLNPKSEH